MPYIPEARRKEFDIAINTIVKDLVLAGNPRGELNYVVYKIVHEYINTMGISYSIMNDFIFGVLGACQAELARRLLFPYEDKKIKENGDIYGTCNDRGRKEKDTGRSDKVRIGYRRNKLTGRAKKAA